MDRLYLDSNAVIFMHEGPTAFQSAIAKILALLQQTGPALFLTSRLARLECRIHPLKNADATLLQLYDDFFDADRLELLEVTPPIIERATDLRVKYGFKTPDAIYLATAIEHNATVFLTGDAKLKRCTELQVDVFI